MYSLIKNEIIAFDFVDYLTSDNNKIREKGLHVEISWCHNIHHIMITH